MPDLVVVTSPVSQTTLVSNVGPAGANGAPGPQGPAGPPGAADPFIFTQVIAALEWLVPHNLNTVYPDVRIYEADGTEVIGDPQAVDPNNLIIYFAVPIAGTAVITL